MVIALLLAASLARADSPPRLVNLLGTVPTTVAVSSTVANANIIPEHLVDGKLTTAWNSKTGELVDAWIGVRLPADVQVKTIKLTAGFVHKNQSGDLFTMNPRIKKVRVSRAGKPVTEQTLDVENRGLQELAVDLPGGDFEIRVLEIVPGSKLNWREICVSELEVWGTLGATAKDTKAKPAVRIGSLDAAPTLTREQCIKALFPSARANRIGPDQSNDAITSVEAMPFRDDLVICRIDHTSKGSSMTSTEIVTVKRGGKPARLGQAVSESTTTEEHPHDGTSDKGSIELAQFPLTTTESGLLVHITQSKEGPMLNDGEQASKLYRVTTSGLVAVLDYQSTWDRGEEDATELCTLQPVTPTGAMPRLVLECIKEKSNWHDEDPRRRRLDKKSRKEHYVWKGSKYEKR